MMKLSDPELWEYIREDLPYFDLTTHLLDAPSIEGNLSIICRDDVVAACTEEAGRIGELLGCRVREAAVSGTAVASGGTLLTLEGDSEALHRAWRLSQILLEYACGIATVARAMRDAVLEVNPHCEILTTRKSFPFAKRFCIRALMCGGIMPHRLGLSETVLLFDKHRDLYADGAAFEAAFRALKKRCVEKKLVVESESFDDAKRMFELGADVVQMDKCSLETLAELVALRDARFPDATILAAGGIGLHNAASYAKTGVDGIVTSSPYQAKTADLTARWSGL